MAGEFKNTVDKMTDAMGGAAGHMSAAMTKTANEFVQTAATSDLYERTSAEIALRRSRNDDIRAAAQKMIVDHNTSTHQLKSALAMRETRDVEHPKEALDKRRETMIQHLEEAPDDSFDSTYLDQQVLAHEEASSLMKSYAHGGDNPQLRSFAEGTGPVVARHLKRMKTLRANL